MNQKDPRTFKDPTPYIKPTLVTALLTVIGAVINPYLGFLLLLLFLTYFITLITRYMRIKKWLKSRGIDPTTPNYAEQEPN